jgi:hypothetical protein
MFLRQGDEVVFPRGTEYTPQWPLACYKHIRSRSSRDLLYQQR